MCVLELSDEPAPRSRVVINSAASSVTDGIVQHSSPAWPSTGQSSAFAVGHTPTSGGSVPAWPSSAGDHPAGSCLSVPHTAASLQSVAVSCPSSTVSVHASSLPGLHHGAAVEPGICTGGESRVGSGSVASLHRAADVGSPPSTTAAVSSSSPAVCYCCC